ncbi:amidohydrolase, partial [Propionibacterium freudenreichii]|nr:amidohydrolase [Propionibacterium freudenreichii]
MPLGPDPYLVSIQDELVALRHELHQIPEVGLDLPQTQQRVLKALEGLPLEITLGKKLSSITAVLRGKAPSNGPRRTVLLRGDMDALPVVEQTGLAWASTNGAMHACGHDC